MTTATPPLLGIDLGTTHSLAAVQDSTGTRRVLAGGDGRVLVPSVVAILEDGAVLVGEEAKALAFRHPERVVHSAKRLIGRSMQEVRIEAARLPYPVVEGPGGGARIRIPLDGKDGRPPFRDYSPEEISAFVLREVLRRSREALGLPNDLDLESRCVVTVPAYFDEAQRHATVQAAEIAGIRDLRLVNEPTAASLAYGLDESAEGRVLVYDLGGGTFDVSLLKIQDGVFRVLATHGDTRLGGDDFDRRILERMLERIREECGAEPRHDPLLLSTLRRAAERIKIRLSEAPEAELEIEGGNSGSFVFRMTREEFESEIEGDLLRSLRAVRATLRDAGIGPAEVDEVLLVGGSTRIPAVRARLEEFFGKPPRTDLDPDLAVALGAAAQAGALAGKAEDLLLLDVIPLSLGIETLGGAFAKLLVRNRTVPCSATEEFSTQVDGQTSVDLNIYQGERELVKDCRKIGTFRLSGLPPMPAGLPRIAVTFTVDEQGLLRVTARELRSGTNAAVEVRPTAGLEEAEVRRLVAESIEHAGEDMAAREAVDLRTKAESVLRGAKAALAEGGEGLAPEQAYALRKALTRLEKLCALENPSTEDLREALDRLSGLTGQLADDLIGAAVTKALREAPKEDEHGPA